MSIINARVYDYLLLNNQSRFSRIKKSLKKFYFTENEHLIIFLKTLLYFS